MLSGHQRLRCASELGLEIVPVLRLEATEEEVNHVAFNLMLNRMTNDMASNESGSVLFQKFATDLDADALARVAPVLDDEALLYACQHATVEDAGIFATEENLSRLDNVAFQAANSCAKRGVVLPIVAQRGSNRILNGLGRWMVARHDGTVGVVWVDDPERGALAERLLNGVSMDFEIRRDSEIADTLRFSSHRAHYARALEGGAKIDHVFLLGLRGKAREAFRVHTIHAPMEPKYLQQWLAVFGRRILDFGGGHGESVACLQALGVDAMLFEPYHVTVGGVGPDFEASRSLVLAFLERLRDRPDWTSIGSSAVLNSIPFPEDRRHVLVLWQALAERSGAKVFATARSRARDKRFAQAAEGGETTGRFGPDVASYSASGFILDGEPGVVLGAFGTKAKIQKYFGDEELRGMFQEHFTEVEVVNTVDFGYIGVVASGPRPVDRAALAAAIQFEFDLPHPGGRRLGLVAEAEKAFGLC